jgi:peptidylprolyl isomerase
MKSRFLRSKVTVFIIIFLVFIGAMVTYSMVYRQESFSRKVLLVTSMGNMTIGLYDDMPITTANFLNLTELGVYDGTIFHRVVYDFVIQGGDPTGTGKGDPSIASIPDELPNRHSNSAGAVAMAKKSGEDGHAVPNSASSQFFINLEDNSNQLNAEYSVFGKVISGMEVAYAIGNVETTGEKPNQNVTITRAQLVE